MSANRTSEPGQPGSQSVVDADLDEGAAYVARMMFKAGAGCSVSFAVVYRLTSNQLFTMILRINRNRTEAEDVLQETYLCAWTRAHWFDQSKGEVLAWLATIARHRAIDSLRQKQHRPQLQWNTEGQNNSDVYEHEPSPSLGPMELTVQRSDARLPPVPI